MAATLGDAVLFLRSDNTGLNKGLDNAESKTKGWASGLGGKMTKLLGGAVVGAAMAGAAAVVGIGAAAFSVSQELDTATKKMQSALGLTADEAERLGDVAVGVFKNNFAGSVTEAAEAVGLVKQQLGDLVDEGDLQGITENAFRLKDAFGVDVAESVSAAQTLMENFGISSDEAFDLVTAGYQKGLDRSGDFLDTINEYSTQFANGGADATEFFNLLDSGLQGGALGTDKAADAFKEFRIRLVDGSDTTAKALEAIGFNVDDIMAGLADGSITTAKVFDDLIGELGGIEDPILRSSIGVGLLGTQFEDLGDAAVLGLGMTTHAFANVEGAALSLDTQYNTLGAAFEGYKRQFLVAIMPIGDALLGIANDAMPYLQVAFDWMSDKLPGIISGAVDIIRAGVDWITKLFSGDLTEGLSDGLGAFQIVKDWIDENMPLIQETIQTVLGAIMAFWDKHGTLIMEIVTRTFDTIMLVVDTVMQSVLGIIRAVMLAINGDWEGAWDEVGLVVTRIFNTLLTVIGNQLQSMISLIINIGPDFIRAGASLISNLWTGINTGFDMLYENTKRKLKELRDLLPFSEPKDASSPLRGLAKSGESIIKNVQDGLNRASLNLGMLSTPLHGEPVIVYQTINTSGAVDNNGIRRASRDGVLDAQRRRGF